MCILFQGDIDKYYKAYVLLDDLFLKAQQNAVSLGELNCVGCYAATEACTLLIVDRSSSQSW